MKQRNLRVSYRIEAYVVAEAPSGVPVNTEYLRQHWDELTVSSISKVEQLAAPTFVDAPPLRGAMSDQDEIELMLLRWKYGRDEQRDIEAWTLADRIVKTFRRDQ